MHVQIHKQCVHMMQVNLPTRTAIVSLKTLLGFEPVSSVPMATALATALSFKASELQSTYICSQSIINLKKYFLKR
jgi:hypothetical protein